ncbi:MAG: DUF5320 domain-containing protein [Desulfosarcina sp.]
MSGLNRTGPQGSGPMTGGARGWCSGDAAAAEVSYGRGLGLRCGRGLRQGRGLGLQPMMGRGGFRNRFALAPDPGVGSETALRQLEQLAQSMRQRLDGLNAQIASLKGNVTEGE